MEVSWVEEGGGDLWRFAGDCEVRAGGIVGVRGSWWKLVEVSWKFLVRRGVGFCADSQEIVRWGGWVCEDDLDFAGGVLLKN